MDFLLFNFFSSLENMALIILILAIHKYRITDYFPQMIMSSILMSVASHTIRFEFHNQNLVTIIVLALLIVFFWLTFQIPIYYSAAITAVGSIAYMIIQTVVLYIGQFVKLYSFESATSAYSMDGYLVQIFSTAAALLVARWLRKKNYGFNYCPFDKYAKVHLKGTNAVFLVIILGSFATIGVIQYFTNSGFVHLTINFLVFVIDLLLMLYFARKKDREFFDR